MFARLALFLVICRLAAAAPTFPALTYSTFLRDNFAPAAIATDPSGNIYIAGNAFVDPASSQTSVLVVKLNPQGTAYLYERFIGGSVNDSVAALAVDSAGNAYIAGVTTSPDFPVTSGSNFGTAPAANTERSFAAKLDPNGQLAFSTLLGASANSYAQAIAVNSTGQVLVSGTSVAEGFPSTPGVYSVTDTGFVPYLLELDPTGTKLIFSATGIGGTALAFDAQGNIYMAGTTSSLTYPLTPGTYQPAFPIFQTCFAPCTGSFQGPNQYVTKLDPTGTKMIFSTSLSGTGNTMNRGLAVDAQGNVYVTGLSGAGYPYTSAVPTIPSAPALEALAVPSLPFLSKLDPTGQRLLYSIPVGGAGVQVDSNGNAYAGGVLGLYYNYDVAASLPALASIPSACFVPEMNSGGKSGYVAQVDSSGNVLGSQFIGGSTLSITGVTLSGAGLWISGTTSNANFPFTPNALISAGLGVNSPEGAYLGAVNFSGPQPPGETPQIACVVDAADLEPAGPVAPYQLLTIFGTSLGPTAPVTAANPATTLGGISVSFGSMPAPLLYVSADQINIAVPLVPVSCPLANCTVSSTGTLQITVNGESSAALAFPLVSANPSLFVTPCGFLPNLQTSFATAVNADGSVNSPTNPAKPESAISIFVNGLSNPEILTGPPRLYTSSPWSIIGTSQPNPYVLQVNLQVPSSNANFNCQVPNTSACGAGFAIYDLSSYLSGSEPGSVGGLWFSGFVYVAQATPATSNFLERGLYLR